MSVMVVSDKTGAEGPEGEQNITFRTFCSLLCTRSKKNYKYLIFMRLSKKVKFENPDPLRPDFDFSSPMHIQPPTFRTIAEAYAHFTRHFKDEDFEEYDDDPDTPPENVAFPSGDTCDFVYFSQSNDGSRSSEPSGATKDGQRAGDEPEGAPATEDEDPSSSTSE